MHAKSMSTVANRYSLSVIYEFGPGGRSEHGSDSKDSRWDISGFPKLPESLKRIPYSKDNEKRTGNTANPSFINETDGVSSIMRIFPWVTFKLPDPCHHLHTTWYVLVR